MFREDLSCVVADHFKAASLVNRLTIAFPDRGLLYPAIGTCQADRQGTNSRLPFTYFPI